MDPDIIKEVNRIGGIVKTQGTGAIFLELEDKNGNIHKLKFENVYYLPGATKLVITYQQWACDRGE